MSTVKTKIPVFDNKLKEARDYWLKKLSREIEPSTLLTDFERPADAIGEQQSFQVTLSKDLSHKLTKLTGDSAFLLYTALMAALKVCLHKYTGSDLIVVGSPARRKENDATPMVNALAVVDEIDSRLTFRKFLMSVRENLVEAYAHQGYPFERVLRDLQLRHVANRCALFDVALGLRNIHGPMPEVRHGLTFTFLKTPAAITGDVQYDGNIFREETVRRFTNHFLHLLSTALDNIDESIGNLEILTEEERRQQLYEWNDTRAEYPREQCVHQLFESQAELTPHAVALCLDEQSLSYAELNRRANQLAHYLRRQGVGAESLVGLMMERSVEMVVGLLGILKAGAAYLPLDPAYPQERLSFMLEDAAVKMLLTQQRLAGRLPWSEAQVVNVDSQWSEIEQESAERIESGVGAGNAAYVIYTSGSTGRPKGVVVEHGGVRNLALAQARAFRVERESRVLQFASLSFDASIFEITMALTVGATLYLGRQESLLPGPGFIELLREQAITIATLPPSVLANLPDAELPALKTITVAGEACPAEVVARWAQGRRFFNLYGPTEATVWATAAECDGDERKPSIGRPIPNAEIFLLDSTLQPVPVGVAGEIYIGGHGLARGYLNRPDLTASSFIPHPFSERAGARLYRTGDVGRYLPDGQIDFVGRVDEQVKVRGFRIELGEVEAALLEQPAVREAVVVTREDVPGDRRLVAYVVPEQDAALKTTELRAALGERLPGYMIPASFVLLEALPLSPNGKVDRRALPAPEGYQAELEATYIAPRSEIENTIAGIWQEALHLTKVGVHDNFFSLGGHSVLMAQVHTRLREVFKKDLAMIDLFKYPTIDALAKYLNEEADEQPSLDESHDRAEVRRELLKRQTRIRQKQAV